MVSTTTTKKPLDPVAADAYLVNLLDLLQPALASRDVDAVGEVLDGPDVDGHDLETIVMVILEQGVIRMKGPAPTEFASAEIIAMLTTGSDDAR